MADCGFSFVLWLIDFWGLYLSGKTAMQGFFVGSTTLGTFLWGKTYPRDIYKAISAAMSLIKKKKKRE